MILTEEEEKLLQMLVDRSNKKKGVWLRLDDVMKELKRDNDTCMTLIEKMQEIEAVDYIMKRKEMTEVVYFRVPPFVQRIWEEIQRQKKTP